MDYDGRATLTEAFVVVKQCDRALCQHSAIDLVSLLMNSNNSRRIRTVAAWSAKVDTNNTLYCRYCVKSNHAKKDCPLKQEKAPTVEKSKQKTVVPTKDLVKEVVKPLSKQLKCSHYGKLNHIKDNYFILHPEKRPSSVQKKALKVKI